MPPSGQANEARSYVTGGLLLVLEAKMVSTWPFVRNGNGLYGELIVGHLERTPLLNSVDWVVISETLAFRRTLAHADIAIAERTVKARAAGDNKVCSIKGNWGAPAVANADAGVAPTSDV